MNLVGKKLSKSFVRREKSFDAVHQVDISLEAGDFAVLYGESGSGKSTLLALLAGISAPTSGKIELDGEELPFDDDKKISFVRNQKFGYIPQNAAVLPNLTVWENVLLPSAFGENFSTSDGDDAENRARFLLNVAGVGNLSGEFPTRLSGGELRRVAVVRALINHPAFIFADEPTSGLDKENADKILDLLSNAALHGAAVLLATHDRESFAFGNRFFQMKSGAFIEVKEKIDN